AFRLSDQMLGVLGQQQPSGNEPVCRGPDRRHVGFLVWITFFSGQPRITSVQSLLFGARKRDEAALQRAESVLETVASAKVPSSIGADGNFEMNPTNAAKVVAVLVDLVNENAIAGIASFGWLDADHAARIRRVKLRTELKDAQRIVYAQEANGR